MPHDDSYGPKSSISLYVQHAALVLIICTLLLSVDEVANQLEYPFRYVLNLQSNNYSFA